MIWSVSRFSMRSAAERPLMRVCSELDPSTLHWCYHDLSSDVLDGAPSSSSARTARRVSAIGRPRDRNKDNPNAESMFKEVNEAYDALKDPDKKAAYDRFGHAAFDGSMGGGGGPRGGFGGGQGDFASAFSDVFDDLFGDFMGGGGRGGGRQRAARGSDLRYNLRITLEEAFSGLQKTINVPTAVQCDTCSGTGAEGGSEPTTCPTCSGMGKVRAQQGFSEPPKETKSEPKNTKKNKT